MSTNKIFAAMLFALCTHGASAAAYGDNSPIYLGGALGQSHQSGWCDGCIVSDKHSGKVYAGFSFAPFSLWQGSEFTGAAELTAYRGIQDSDSVPGYRDAFKGAGLGYRLSLRETEALSLHARLGVTRLTSMQEWRGQNWSNSKTGLTGGVGVSYALGRHWSLTADYDRLQLSDKVGKNRLHMVTFGAGYKF